MYSLRSNNKRRNVCSKKATVKNCSEKSIQKDTLSGYMVLPRAVESNRLHSQPSIVDSPSACSEVSIKLSPLPCAIVKDYINSSGLDSSPQFSGLKKWLNSSNSSSQSSFAEVKAATDQTSRKTMPRRTCNSHRTQASATSLQRSVSRKKEKAVTLLEHAASNRKAKLSKKTPLRTIATRSNDLSFSIFTDVCAGSGSDTSTPVQQTVAVPCCDAKENLFGFEKLLLPKPPQIDDCKVSPIGNDSGVTKRKKKPLQNNFNQTPKISISQYGLTSRQKSLNKSTSHVVKPKRSNSNVKLSQESSDIILFDSTANMIPTKMSKHSAEDTSDSDTASCQLAKASSKKAAGKQKPKKTALVRFQEPQIAWEDIMNHELVIE